MDVETAARFTRNQAVFRAVNERVRSINETFSVLVPLGDWVCECANHACHERIEVTSDEYEAVRAHPRRFAVAASESHYVPEIEEVVDKHDRFWVLEKTGEAGHLAEMSNPRRAAELRIAT